jgi:hypothetical protein
VSEKAIETFSEHVTRIAGESQMALAGIPSDISALLKNLEILSTALHGLPDQIVARCEATQREIEAKIESTIPPQLEAISNAVHSLYDHAMTRNEEGLRKTEIEACRSLQNRSIFIIGFARSCTTITAQMLNTSDDAYILGEANFFMRTKEEGRFRDWYNDQHVSFKNQVTKTCYAPDFLPSEPHQWWQWLEEAAQNYPFVGDKMALTYGHFQQFSPEFIQAFFEARFYLSKYIFLLRDPRQTLLSVRKLFNYANDEDIMPQVIGWLTYIKLWCDWIRVFPHTLTLTTDHIEDGFVDAISDFTGLKLETAKKLIDDRSRRKHTMSAKEKSLSAVGNELVEIYQMAQRALHQDRSDWQSEQKRGLSLNDTVANLQAPTSVQPHALGQTWAMADDLLRRLTS